ncbi:Pycsar system effector family protein [Glycomyces rhizosphaerae]|uniref:Pycsar system effector family protein n=1 Tax=Glycomyces rhizosphaerae TaxID=2054422 RepID=A0ABV7Q084_9ACTN
MGTPPSMAAKHALDEVHRQIDHARVNVAHADTKAALLAAGAIPITALLLAAPSLTQPFGVFSVTAWAAAAFMSAGIAFLGAAVWPRLSGHTGIRVGARHSPDEIIRTVLRHSADSERQLHHAAEELSMLATLAYEKFKRVRAAMTCFAVAAVLVLVTALAFVVSG